MLGATSGVQAQTMRADSLPNGVVVYNDVRLAALTKLQSDVNEKNNLTRKFSHGFRIQVMNSNDRNKVMEAKTKLLQNFPEEKVYLLYQAPFFKLRFGNFRTRPDAENYQQQLNQLFPGVFVIPSPIEPKPEWFKQAADDGTL